MSERKPLFEGQELYFVPSRRASPAYIVTVVTVGRKWAKLSNGARANIKTWVIDSGGFAALGELWESAAANAESKAISSAYRDLRNDIGYFPPEGVTTADIDAARQLLRLGRRSP